MPLVTVTRRLRFNAAHRVHNPALSDEENRRLFGKCNNPNWHGHNYKLEVSVTGAIDERTGYVIDLGVLKRIVEDEVISQLDHRNMNIDVPFMRGVIPTSENIVVACWRQLAPALRPDGSRGSASGKPRTTMSSTTGSDELERPSRRHRGAASNGDGRAQAAGRACAARAIAGAVRRRPIAPSSRCWSAASSSCSARIPTAKGSQKTPERVAKALACLTRGYQVDVERR